jgi:hypothetical protein
MHFEGIRCVYIRDTGEKVPRFRYKQIPILTLICVRRQDIHLENYLGFNVYSFYFASKQWKSDHVYLMTIQENPSSGSRNIAETTKPKYKL